jgi:hypothetical protein
MASVPNDEWKLSKKKLMGTAGRGSHYRGTKAIVLQLGFDRLSQKRVNTLVRDLRRAKKGPRVKIAAQGADVGRKPHADQNVYMIAHVSESLYLAISSQRQRFHNDNRPSPVGYIERGTSPGQMPYGIHGQGWPANNTRVGDYRGHLVCAATGTVEEGRQDGGVAVAQRNARKNFVPGYIWVKTRMHTTATAGEEQRFFQQSRVFGPTLAGPIPS